MLRLITVVCLLADAVAFAPTLPLRGMTLKSATTAGSSISSKAVSRRGFAGLAVRSSLKSEQQEALQIQTVSFYSFCEIGRAMTTFPPFLRFLMLRILRFLHCVIVLPSTS